MSNTLPRMRGISAAVLELKEMDCNSALTVHALRQLVLSGAVPSVRVGRKYLVDLNKLFEFLSGEQTAPTPTNTPKIRAVTE